MKTPSISYFIRSSDGVTCDVLTNREQALSYARKNRLQVYEVDKASGRSVRIL